MRPLMISKYIKKEVGNNILTANGYKSETVARILKNLELSRKGINKTILKKRYVYGTKEEKEFVYNTIKYWWNNTSCSRSTDTYISDQNISKEYSIYGFLDINKASNILENNFEQVLKYYGGN